MKHHLARWQPWLSTAGRLFLAGVFVVAGWPKLIHSEDTVRSVRAFQILPEALVPPFAFALPVVELALALLLVIGLFTRGAALVYAAMMVMFLGGIVSAWTRGLSIDCGCFGSAGTLVTDPVPGYIRDILRDVGLLLLALGVARWPRGVADVDRFLGLTPAPPAADPAH
jgi:uncharacterized membrane protein YphA (DoxX/SURF4 family)